MQPDDSDSVTLHLHIPWHLSLVVGADVRRGLLEGSSQWRRNATHRGRHHVFGHDQLAEVDTIESGRELPQCGVSRLPDQVENLTDLGHRAVTGGPGPWQPVSQRTRQPTQVEAAQHPPNATGRSMGQPLVSVILPR